MTESATQFISALTLGTLSRNPVLTSFWEEEGWQPGHIELADKIDLFLVAPATAQQLGNYAKWLGPRFIGCDLFGDQGAGHARPCNERKDVRARSGAKEHGNYKGQGSGNHRTGGR